MSRLVSSGPRVELTLKSKPIHNTEVPSEIDTPEISATMYW